MRVLLLSPLYHPYVGGAETHTRLLAEGLREAGHDVAVITDRGYADQPRLQTHHDVRIARTTAFGFGDPAARESVRWEVGLFDLVADIKVCLDLLTTPRQGRFDIVHAQGQGAFLPGAVVAGELGVPLVVTSHETLPFGDPMGAARSGTLYGLPAVAKVIAGSRFFVQQALASGVPPDRVELVPFGMAAVAQAPEPTSLPAAGHDQPLLITSIGRFKPRKNQLALVEAVRRLRDDGLDVRCTLVGRYDASSKRYYDEVLAAVADACLEEHLQIRSDLDDEGRSRVLAESHLAVQPARHEGFGLASLEAVMAGRITVVAPNEGHREVFGADSPFLADGFSAVDLVTKIHDVVASPKRYHAELARARTVFAQRNSAQAAARRTAAVYRGVLGRLS